MLMDGRKLSEVSEVSFEHVEDKQHGTFFLLCTVLQQHRRYGYFGILARSYLVVFNCEMKYKAMDV